ncbi:WD40-repeat-containing domain protein [Dipodascopsis tothii]|uniref:WD40-repeat-containing domain protein n=1 Tax=Dipodascopsis tothii TaxID=44089 RepID=UPI0034CD0EAB
MKVKTLSRSADTYLPAQNTEVSRLPRNLNPELHPFERAREYTRALNATKMERLFAAPFIGQLGNGHIDGVYALCKDLRRLNTCASGSGDGVLKFWDMSTREELQSIQAHRGTIRGLTVTVDGRLLSAGMDSTVKLWDASSNGSAEPITTFMGTSGFTGIDHHRVDPIFVTSSAAVEIWDENRSKPISNMSWGADNIVTCKFNPVEQPLLASAGADRSIVIHDMRTNSPVQKVVATMRTNALCWHPLEAFNLAAASEDHNAYLYDMRKLTRALNVWKGHVSAVMDVDFSPTGEEIVTSSYDRTLRIFKTRDGHSRDIYHTKRMQRVFSAKFTMDTRYIVSGSDDGNVRVWRSEASSRANVRSARERSKLEYDAALKERYKHMPEIRRIARHRHVPKAIKTATATKRVEIESIKRKEDNVRKHSKKGAVPFQKEREKHIIGVAIKDAKDAPEGK